MDFARFCVCVCRYAQTGEQCSAAKNFDYPNTDDPLYLIPLFKKKKSTSSRALGVLKLFWKGKQLI